MTNAEDASAGDESPGCSLEPVETDPSGRYLRYPLLLGRGACKQVYRGFDCEHGREVAWNKVPLAHIAEDPSGEALRQDYDPIEQLLCEIHVLQQLHHKNIMTLYDWWYDGFTHTINFITEVFAAGTLRAYRRKGLVDAKVINQDYMSSANWNDDAGWDLVSYMARHVAKLELARVRDAAFFAVSGDEATSRDKLSYFSLTAYIMVKWERVPTVLDVPRIDDAPNAETLTEMLTKP
ncbi:hypothetical protein FOA52_009313 [Chlamydomonas sp. UWO 241]|nr:hypothetical protein FOA52_009313 [Chlamydomonas sp. UWO 241]